MSREWICILILITSGWSCIAQTPQIEWQHVGPQPGDHAEYLNGLASDDGLLFTSASSGRTLPPRFQDEEQLIETA